LQKRFSSEQYSPAEDTFFLADYIQKEKGQSALDIGTGSGYLARVLSTNFSLVIATDIDFNSLKSQKSKFPFIICCNAADALRHEFDLIVCNMPYLPSEQVSDKTTDGGKEGMEVPLRIIKSSKNCLKSGGKILFLTSTIANYQKLLEKTKKLGLNVKIVGRKKLFFEELLLVEARK